VQFLGESVKPFRIYRKMKYLTFDFDLWPWSQGHEKNPPTFLVGIFGPNLNKIGSVFFEKIDLFPTKKKKQKKNNKYRAMTVVHYSHLLVLKLIGY